MRPLARLHFLTTPFLQIIAILARTSTPFELPRSVPPICRLFSLFLNTIPGTNKPVKPQKKDRWFMASVIALEKPVLGLDSAGTLMTTEEFDAVEAWDDN